jgi:hypothetical protein
MFKFIYARYKLHPELSQICEGWFLLLDTIESFNDFLDKRSNSLVKSYFNLKANASRTEPYRYKNGDHMNIGDEYTISNLLWLDNSRKTVMDDCRCMDKLLSGYQNVFLNYGHVIVNSVNGCRAMDESFEILEERLSNELVFPVTSEKDIKISKWPNGTHYYAKIGNQDVVDDKGNVKWNTVEQAKKEAVKYLRKKKGIKNEYTTNFNKCDCI